MCFFVFWPTRAVSCVRNRRGLNDDWEKGDCVILPRYLDLELIFPYCLSINTCVIVIESINFGMCSLSANN